MSDEQVLIMKRGDTCIQIGLHREASSGLLLLVKAHKGVEDFMHAQSNGQTVAVSTLGRYWNSEHLLSAYVLGQPFELRPTDDGTVFNLNALGLPLTYNGEVNLSFLRLVGISEGAGVSFGVKGVYSLEALRNLNDKFSRTARRFYIDFLKPVDLGVTVSTHEL